MKLAIATTLIASASAFSPAAKVCIMNYIADLRCLVCDCIVYNYM